jgi:hypothetical protein
MKKKKKKKKLYLLRWKKSLYESSHDDFMGRREPFHLSQCMKHTSCTSLWGFMYPVPVYWRLWNTVWRSSCLSLQFPRLILTCVRYQNKREIDSTKDTLKNCNSYEQKLEVTLRNIATPRMQPLTSFVKRTGKSGWIPGDLAKTRIRCISKSNLKRYRWSKLINHVSLDATLSYRTRNISLPLFRRTEKHWCLQMQRPRLESGTSQGRIISVNAEPSSSAMLVTMQQCHTAHETCSFFCSEQLKNHTGSLMPLPRLESGTSDGHVDGRNRLGRCELDWARSGKNPMPTFCKHAMLKNFQLFTDRRLLSQLSNYQLLKEHAEPRSLSSVPT